MKSEEVGRILEAARRSIEAGGELKGTGFWKAVAAARKDPVLAGRWAGEIAEIDRAAFEKGVSLRVPAFVGTAALSCGTIAAAGILVSLNRVEQDPLRTLLFFGAFGTLLLTTHSLAHWMVGRLCGIRFTHYFLGGPAPPRPGAKVDYASYLKVSPAKRAVMHASGALVTKVLPFALIPFAGAFDLPGWSVVVLVIVGLVQIITDILFSTKSSDWKKVKRELKAGRRAGKA